MQRYFQASAAPGMSRPAWWILGDLLTQLGEPTSFFMASEAFAALAAAHPEFAGMSYDSLGLRGQLIERAARHTGGRAMMLPFVLAQQAVYHQYYDPLVPVTATPWLLFTILKMLIVFTVIMVGVAMLTLAERKISAWIQDRIGPNRTGYGGLLQPAADGLKNIMKEETYPDAAYMPLFILAPMLSFIPALITFAVIPFAAPLSTRWGLVEMSVANVPIGFLYILAISSLGVYGIVLAGWSSNNKYSLLGGLRSSAQMVSYEIAMGMAAVSVLLLAGNVSLPAIVQQQQGMGWNVFPLLIGFFIFCVASFAETNRLPFDLPEAESELIAGYHTEYSAMKFSMFFIAEYSNMVTASALMVTLFFGGWDIPGTQWDNVAAAHGSQDRAHPRVLSSRSCCSSCSSTCGSAGRCRVSATIS